MFTGPLGWPGYILTKRERGWAQILQWSANVVFSSNFLFLTKIRWHRTRIPPATRSKMVSRTFGTEPSGGYIDAPGLGFENMQAAISNNQVVTNLAFLLVSKIQTRAQNLSRYTGYTFSPSPPLLGQKRKRSTSKSEALLEFYGTSDLVGWFALFFHLVTDQ